MSKKDISLLKQDNTFTATVFDGRLILHFAPNSMLKRITGTKIADDVREALKADAAYSNGAYQHVENFIPFFGLFCATFMGCEWHPKGDEQPGLIWLAHQLLHWDSLTQIERWTVRMESDLSQWETIAEGFFDQKVVNIPIESRPAELLTAEEKAAALNPKATSSLSAGDGSTSS